VQTTGVRKTKAEQIQTQRKLVFFAFFSPITLYLQTPHLPPSLAQCLQYLQFLQALHGSAPVHVAASMRAASKGTATRKAIIIACANIAEMRGFAKVDLLDCVVVCY
jgi:hypothetical protein